jgi:hypothetical protein
MASVTYKEYENDDDIIAIHIETEHLLNSIAGFQDVLRKLVEITKDIDAIKNLNEKAYGFRLKAKGAEGVILDESEFFVLVGEHESLWETAVCYVRNITAWNAIEDNYFNGPSNPYHDEENDAGRFAIHMLVVKKPEYVRDFTNFLWTIDLDHSCIEIEDIVSPIQKWGWNDDALELVAAYHDCLPGQGFDEFATLTGLTEYLSKTNSHQYFLDICLKEFVKHKKYIEDYDLDPFIDIFFAEGTPENQNLKQYVCDYIAKNKPEITQ